MDRMSLRTSVWVCICRNTLIAGFLTVIGSGVALGQVLLPAVGQSSGTLGLEQESDERLRIAGNPTRVPPNSPPKVGEPFEPGRVLAIVADQPILAGDLLLMINEIIQNQAAEAPAFVREKMLEQGIRELLPRAIERKMMYHEALLLLPETAKVEDIKKDLYGQIEEKQLPQILKKYQATNLAELDARLRSLGGSWRALKEQIVEQEIAKYAVMSQLEVDTEVSYQELLKQYERDRDNYRIEEQVRWEHLMVSFSETPDRREARRKLVEMGNEIVYGAAFAEVAKRGSDDFFASQGGYNDWTKRGGLKDTKLEDRLFQEPVGKLSDIIETESGLHIIRVIERQEAGMIPFSKVQDEIRQRIVEDRQNAAVEKVVAKIKQRIPYEILIDGVDF
jgi:parvulin-like peptidyl-prolyl isomerase